MNILKDIGWVIVAFILLAIATLFLIYDGKAGSVKSVKWDASLIDRPRVSISVIKEISDAPHTYVLVRDVATSTPNIGEYPGVMLNPGEQIEVECPLSDTECHGQISQ